MDPIAIGILGMMCIVLAFFMIETNRWKSHSKEYDWVNLVGGTLLLIYSFLIESLPFQILNGVWVAISIRDLVNLEKKKHHRWFHKRR